MRTKYYVQIVNNETGGCIKQMEAESERQAEKIELGVLINMDLMRYHVKISQEPMKVVKD
jgi:hypothetical protein